VSRSLSHSHKCSTIIPLVWLLSIQIGIPSAQQNMMNNEPTGRRSGTFRRHKYNAAAAAGVATERYCSDNNEGAVGDEVKRSSQVL
jgi:hypothetical protein